MLMLTHFLLAPFYYVPHTLTSFFLCYSVQHQNFIELMFFRYSAFVVTVCINASS
jgi:hypothetical protein